MTSNFDLFLTELMNFEKRPDIIVLTEIWINNDEINCYSINGYDWLSHCSNNYRMGGVTVYVQRYLP